MLTLKFMNPEDLDYRVYHVDHYQVETRPNSAIEGGFQKFVVLNPDKWDSDKEPLQSIGVVGTVYVMNEHGKTVDTIYTPTLR